MSHSWDMTQRDNADKVRAVIERITGGASLRDLGEAAGTSKDTVSRDLASGELPSDSIIRIARHWNYSPVRALVESGRLERDDVIWEAGAIELTHATDDDLAAEVLSRMREGRSDHSIFARPITELSALGLHPLIPTLEVPHFLSKPLEPTDPDEDS